MSESDNTKGGPKGAESSRKAAEEKYGTVVRTAMDGFWLIDAKGRIIDTNDAYCRMTGYSREELLGGMRVQDIEANESDCDVAAHMRKVIELGSDRFESRHRRKDASVIELEVNANYLNIDGGYFFAFFRDMTALRKNETDLRVLSSVIEQSPAAVLITDAEGVIQYVNPMFETTTGYSSPELAGKKPGILKSGVHPPEFYKEMWSTITSGRPWRGDICNRKKTGELYWELKNISPIKDSSGKITHYVGIQVEDIERKKAEEKLRRSEERLAEAQKIAHIGNWEWDMAANEIWWSDEIYRIFGLKRQEFGATYEDYLNSVHPDDRELVRETVNAALNDKSPCKLLHRIVLPGGEVRIVHARAELLLDPSGVPVRMRGTLQDITECKLMEDEIHKTQKLESLGVLAGGIAHEFNNILTGIAGNMFLIKKASTGNDAIDVRLEVVDNALNRAKGLTNKLLTFSSGGTPVKQSIDTARLAADTARLVFSGSRVKYDINEGEGLWTVEADEGQIDQVLQNIYINALQAMPEGGVVAVTIKNSFGPGELPDMKGSYVLISITDNGPGIPEEHIKKVFDPFFSTKPGGSGLGLSICFSIVKKHSGYIKVESSVNTGTGFFLYLPALKTVPSIHKEAESISKCLAGKRCRILVMDDEDMVRDTAQVILTELGYEVVLSSDGEEALDIYRKAMESGNSFDLVVMDLTVQGGMGGSDAIVTLLSMDPGARAIVSSGYCNSPVMSDFKKYGFKGVLRKPYNVGELTHAVKKALSEA